MNATTQGRRRSYETPVHEMEPGDYKWVDGSILWGVTPAGEICRIDDRWKIEEHGDGTITVGPLESGGASSIWVNKPHGWHGYLQNGIWVNC